jgi:hypothetical protein
LFIVLYILLDEGIKLLNKIYTLLFSLVDLSLFKLVIERQIQKSKEEQDAAGDASDLMPGEEVEDPTPETNVCTHFF